MTSTLLAPGATPEHAIARLTEVRDVILARPERFNMELFFEGPDNTDVTAPECGTVCCIGGWAVAIEAARQGVTPKDLYRNGDTILGAASKALGITEDVGFHLFFAAGLDWTADYCSMADITPAQAADAIDALCDRIRAEAGLLSAADEPLALGDVFAGVPGRVAVQA